MLFECGAIAQVIVERQAGVIDEDIERFNSLDGCLNLRRVGHVQGYGRDAPIQVGQGLARSGIHALRASPQGFCDQRLSDAAIGASHQHRFVCDHCKLSFDFTLESGPVRHRPTPVSRVC